MALIKRQSPMSAERFEQQVEKARRLSHSVGTLLVDSETKLQKKMHVVKKKTQHETEMLPEYDFCKGIRGKYYGRYAQFAAVLSGPHLEAGAQRANGRGWKPLDEVSDALPLLGDERP
jgi:excinuclease UvrABC helicase subunit UvrB